MDRKTCCGQGENASGRGPIIDYLREMDLPSNASGVEGRSISMALIQTVPSQRLYTSPIQRSCIGKREGHKRLRQLGEFLLSVRTECETRDLPLLWQFNRR